MDNLARDPKKFCCLIICLVALLVFIIIFAFSWDTVEPTDLALKCSSISKNCDPTQSKNFDHKITFLKNIYNICFSLHWRKIFRLDDKLLRPFSFNFTNN